LYGIIGAPAAYLEKYVFHVLHPLRPIIFYILSHFITQVFSKQQKQSASKTAFGLLCAKGSPFHAKLSLSPSGKNVL
ncbi:MAG: hypothetical protein J6S60_00745, partial [Oscillospiraceae bacterium]|nr:hypothetical protein [Oscillospiraceae bacterium]